jgi:dTDP-4-amino-4,6-dideoxygalactose transaminase
MTKTAAFPGWPSFTREEAETVSEVLLSNRVNYWTGEEGKRFEAEFAAAMGSRHAVALANGTVALELALRVLGIGPGDEVVVTPRTFIASASCIHAVGGRPVFADVDPESQNITADTVEPVLTPRTRAILCVHLAGWPCDMPAITALAGRRGLWVVEDCAQAHGATVLGRSVGSWGHVAAWSFCQDKIMTTGGEGGMLTTGDAELWRKAWEFKDHGKSWTAVNEPDPAPGFRWLHHSFGTNWRMTEIQAAIGRIQLKRLPHWVEARRRNAGHLTRRLRHIPAVRIPQPDAVLRHAYYKYYLFVRPERLKSGWNRDRIHRALLERGLPCLTGVCPELYREKAFASAGHPEHPRLPTARMLGETSLALNVHPTLTTEHMDRAADILESVLGEASR